MLSSIDQNIARDFKKRLKNTIKLIDFCVYGSRARGDASPESDLDVFIEVESITKEQRLKISEIAWEVGFERNRLISVFVATRDQKNNGPLAANPILFKIENQGVHL